jgi:serine/threonine protein kinase
MSKTLEIPGYKIKKELGAGGMAHVFLAVETKLDRQVALKVLSPSYAENERITKRFIKEAKTAAKLDHTNIVHIYDVGKHKEYNYIAMEYLAGNLKDKIDKSGGLKPKEALTIVKEVAKALSYAHDKGYIHRDIKPDNIMFRKDGAVVLVDFGIVKAINEEEQTKLTRTGMSIGTPKYMSPEQLQARKLDERSDIYSLGIVFYEMLTGKAPYEATDIVTLALMHTGEPLPDLPKKLQEYTPLLDKMVAKNPRERVRNTQGLIRLVDALLSKIKEREEKINLGELPKKKKKRRFLPFVATLLILAGMAAAYYFYMDLTKKRQETTDWQNAQKEDTISAYRNYLDRYPQGKYIQQAVAAVNRVRKENDYQAEFKEAEKLFRLGQYENALKHTEAAKKIKSTPQLETLEYNIRKTFQEEKDKQFGEYLKMAQDAYDLGDMETAKEWIEKAKLIKSSEELKALELKVVGPVETPDK